MSDDILRMVALRYARRDWHAMGIADREIVEALTRDGWLQDGPIPNGFTGRAVADKTMIPKVADAKDLIVGEFYWIEYADGNNPPYLPAISQCTAHNNGEWKQIYGHWCHEDNDQFTGKYVAYGPIPRRQQP